MASVSPVHTHLNAGEISPRLSGRVDLSWYASSCALMSNMLPLPHGPATRRPPTLFIGAAKTSSPKFLPFEANVTSAYVVELTDLAARFWTDLAQVESAPGVPLEIVTPWPAADLPRLRKTQSADSMWIFHPSYQPRILRRTSPTSFTLQLFEFIDGPYLTENVTATTLTPAATTGNGITLTASAPVFAATDVGRAVRLRHTDTGPDPDEQIWGWAKIVGFTSSTVVTIDIKKDFLAATATAVWRLGLFSATTGWPTAGTIHGERLVLASNIGGQFPRIDGSAPGVYDTFSPGTTDGDAYSFGLGADSLPIVTDIVSMRGLMVLTNSIEIGFPTDSNSEPISPTNIRRADPFAKEGAANVAAVVAKASILFIQRTGRALIEMKRSVEVEGWQSNDISLRAEHLMDQSPLIELTWANRPYNALWGCRADGGFLGCTYQPEQAVTAWHRQKLGGDGMVKTLAPLPAEDGDETWMAVQRGNRCDVEVMRFPLRDHENPARGWHLDSALELEATNEVQDLTVGVVGGVLQASAAAPLFVGGDVDREITGFWIDGEEANGMPLWKRTDLKVLSVTSATIAVVQPLDGTNIAAVLKTGDWRWKVETVSGLAHLEGKTVGVCADAGDIGDFVVSGGSITLPYKAGFVAVGYRYRSRVWPTRPEGGSQKGTNIDKPRRVRAVGVRLVRSGTVFVGIAGKQLVEMPVRANPNSLNRPPPLVSRDVRIPIGSTTADDGYVAVETDNCMPLTVACVVHSLDVGDAA